MNFFANTNVEKFTWIELTGFDREAQDWGVGDFLSRAGFRPTGVSLLLYWVGFVFSHRGLDRERKLSPAEDSYGGHPYAPERPRQPWTNWELKGLIDELHKYGIKVYLSYFNMCSFEDDDGKIVVHEDFLQWEDGLNDKNRQGKNVGALGMLKRLPDGRYFEDLLMEKTVTAMVDYGFDGLQISDGISSPRVALEQGDYSADMLDQFTAYTGLTLPKDDGNIGDWIWKNHRLEWIYFHTARWNTFYRKFMDALHAVGKEAIFNSAWTRDPFEAMYRYGVDYRLVAKTGVSGCMVEDTSPALAILADHDNGYLMTDEQRKKVHYEFLTTLMLNRAAMPGLSITPLQSVHDTMEQWGVLEHMPTSMTRNVMNNLCTYILSDQGIKPITDGPYFCLCDGLSASDWAFIRKQWDIGAIENPIAVTGLAVVWSDRRLDRELEAFVQRRTTPTHRLVSELMYAGAPVYSVVRIEHIDHLTVPLLVTNPALLPKDELAKVLAYSQKSLVFFLGEGAEQLNFVTAVQEKNSFGGISLTASAWSGDCISIENDAVYDFDARDGMEKVGCLWTHPLCFAPILATFFQHSADVINRSVQAPAVKLEYVDEMGRTNRPCKCLMTITGEKTARVLLTNDDYFYNIPDVDLGREISSIRCLTKYIGYRVKFNGSHFVSRVPGRGAEAFEVEFA